QRNRPTMEAERSQPSDFDSDDGSRNYGQVYQSHVTDDESIVSEAPSQGSRSRSRRRNRRRRNNRRNNNAVPELDGLTNTASSAVNQVSNQVGNTANQVGNTAGQVANTAGQVAGGAKEKDDNPLKLRLDLNLDVDIELRARVHGDVTLALL
ncbi:hypothetical protein BX666DRAFT_1835293, partial [Dichotomocladium elegans]